MLPPELSTDRTSLNQDQDREAMVCDMAIDDTGAIVKSDIYRALVRNKAQLAYNAIAAWLEGTGPAPAALARVPGLDAQRPAAGRHRRPPSRPARRPGGARVRALRAAPGGRGRRRQGPAHRDDQPGQDHHRELHGGRQRRGRAVPTDARLRLHPPGRQDPGALGAHRRSGGADGGSLPAAATRARCRSS